MFKKSQITIYVLVVLIIGLSLFLGLGGIKTIKNIETKAEINNFVNTLENSLKAQKMKTLGSVDPVVLSLPSNIQKICFIDDKEKFSPNNFLELTKEKNIYKDKNLFFFPSEEFAPAKIEFIKLKELENPLCVNVINGKLNLKLTTLKDNTLIEAANEKDITKNCIIVPGSKLGNPDEKIDIVFLGFGYKDKTLFSKDVSDYTNNYLFKTEPFLSNKDKFNIWMIDQNEPDCSVKDYIVCDSLSVNKLVSNCPNDYVFILADKLSLSIRSSAISNMAKLNTRDNKLVLLHEYAHIFANLADEYTDKYYKDWFDASKYPNCDYKECSKWVDIQGTDCIKGCSTNQFYRSTQTSIMRNYDKSSDFGILNEKVINENLEVYK